jgi:hypothetical protein
MSLVLLLLLAVATRCATRSSTSGWRDFRVDAQKPCDDERDASECGAATLQQYARWHRLMVDQIRAGTVECGDVRALLFSPTDGVRQLRVKKRLFGEKFGFCF